jgi:hypothetical protein
MERIVLYARVHIRNSQTMVDENLQTRARYGVIKQYWTATSFFLVRF